MTVIPVHRHRSPALVGAAGLLLVLLLTFFHAPVAVRTLIGLPLLVGISGAAWSAVLVPDQRRLEGFTRIGLVVLLGLGTLVASGLLVAVVVRGGLPASRVVLVHTLLTAVPLGVLARRGSALPARRTSFPSSTVWSGVLGVALLAGAVLLATRLIPDRPDSPTFAFTGPAATAPGPIRVAPGQSVPLGWSLQAPKSSASPTLQAAVDGDPAEVSTTSTAGRSGEYSGVATVPVPAEQGVHRVVLSAALPGQRLELVTYVDVQAATQ